MQKTKTPLVSVLMTAYNREKYIAEAIESVIASTYANFELIIVDDRSSDQTVSIAKAFAAKDNRVKVFINENNLGDYPNRNQAAGYATGDLQMYVDSDDTINPDGLEYVVKMMQQHPEVNYATLYYRDDIKTEKVLSSVEAIHKHFFDISFLIVGPGGTVVRRDFFNKMGKFPVKYGPANDMYYNIKMASNSPVLVMMNKYLNYRIHEGQEQNNKYAYLYNNYLYFTDCLKIPELPLSKTEKKILLKKCKRRFLVNVLKYFAGTKDLNKTRGAIRMAGYKITDALEGIFH